MTEVKIFSKTRDAWHAVYTDCVNAKHSIYCEQYILKNDSNGHAFLELFARKAKEGLDVNISLDKIGCRYVYKSPLIEKIREHNGRVDFYNNINWFNLVLPWTWLPRNHTKIFLIDDTVAYIGSFCLADYMVDWLDVVIRLQDPRLHKLFYKKSLVESPVSPSNQEKLDGMEYVISQPSLPPNQVYETVLDKIQHAKTSIYMASPYFLPPSRLKHALIEAAQRGIEVKIVITRETDRPVARNVTLSFLPELMKTGVRFYAFKNTVMHAKYMIIDRKWAVLGSANLDYLSIIHNREGNLLIHHKNVINSLARLFMKTLDKSENLDMTCWRQLPLKDKIKGWLARPFKKLM